MEATAHPERIPSHHPHAFADHSRQFAFSSLGNVNHREWSANVRKYLYGGGGALGEQASCLLCLLIHRCQTDFKQISVLHLSYICGQTGDTRRRTPRTHTIASSTRICGPFTAIHVLLLGNVNVREWSANGRKYLLGDDGLSADVLSVRRCQTDVSQNRFCRCSRALRCIPNAHHRIIYTHLRTIHGNPPSSLRERKCP